MSDSDLLKEMRSKKIVEVELFNKAADRIEALAARVAKLETLLKAARQVSEAAEGIYIEVSDQEAEHLRETFGELDAAIARAVLGEAS